MQFVPSLAHNLLRVEQLMTSGYSVVFNGGSCAINDKKADQSITSISLTHNRTFL